jgi:ADP-heptose:LPS heptosyltransferase
MRGFLIHGYSIFLWILDTLYLSFQKSLVDKSSSILLVRLDNIGDFILWLPSAGRLREKYKNHSLILVANESFSELAKETGYFDKVISINTRKFIFNLVYRYKNYSKITTLNSEISIHPNFSRVFLLGDSIIRASKSSERIGSSGDLSNIYKWQKNISDSWYTKLIATSGKSLMELERDAEFLSGLGVVSENIGTPKLPVLNITPGKINISKDYFIIFPGASWAGRKWPNESFAKIGTIISKQYGYKMVICGLKSEYDDARSIISQASIDSAINLAGETTLSEFCELVRGARLLIGNETSAVHIAAATNTPSICLLGGGHFGRFIPYSEKVKGISPVAVFSKMDCYGCNWKCTQIHNKNEATPCIKKIKVSDVLHEVDKLLF